MLTDPNWRVTVTADLNGDGKSDLIWYNNLTGQTSVWMMNGASMTQGAVLLADPDWEVIAAPDLNGDGKADLLWHNAATGQTAAWLMNGATATSQTLLLNSFSWNVIATRDFNGDGKADLLWFNPDTGQTSTWLMNGTSIASGPLLLTDPNWRQATQADTASYSVRFFNFIDRFNYTTRYYSSNNVPDSTGLYTYYDLRVGQSSGVAIPTANLYDTALYATLDGWKSVDGTVANTNTGGKNAVSSYGWGYRYTNLRYSYDVSGQPMASVVALTQNTAGTSTSTMVGVDPSLLTGTMPAGSRLQTITSVSTATPVGYRTSDGTVGLGVTTLTSMVAAFPTPASPTGSNTVSTGNLHGSTGCGTTICVQERTRVAFSGGNTTTYYLCDTNTSTNTSYNCVADGTGTFVLGTALDGVSPIMTFANLPAAWAVKTYERVFVETNGAVYFGFQDKLSTATQTRLNNIGFRAVAAQLGISAP